MCVDIHEAGEDGLAANVNYFRSRIRVKFSGRADFLDAIIFDEHVAAIDTLLTLHGDDARAAQKQLALGNITRHFESDGKLLRFPLLRLFRFKGRLARDSRVIVAETPGDGLSAVSPVNVIRAGGGEALERNGRSFQIEAHGLRAESGKGGEIGVVAILDGKILFIGRRHGHHEVALKSHVRFFIGAIEAHRAQDSRGLLRAFGIRRRRRGIHVINARAVRIERGRLIAIGQFHDCVGLAAIGRDPAEFVDVAGVFRQPTARRAHHENQLASIGRPRR